MERPAYLWLLTMLQLLSLRAEGVQWGGEMYQSLVAG
jgi:hypothetical protein